MDTSVIPIVLPHSPPPRLHVLLIMCVLSPAAPSALGRPAASPQSVWMSAPLTALTFCLLRKLTSAHRYGYCQPSTCQSRYELERNGVACNFATSTWRLRGAVNVVYIEQAGLITACTEHGGRLKLAQARQAVKIDVNKTRKIFNYLEENGLINTAS